MSSLLLIKYFIFCGLSCILFCTCINLGCFQVLAVANRLAITRDVRWLLMNLTSLNSVTSSWITRPYSSCTYTVLRDANNTVFPSCCTDSHSPSIVSKDSLSYVFASMCSMCFSLSWPLWLEQTGVLCFFFAFSWWLVMLCMFYLFESSCNSWLFVRLSLKNLLSIFKYMYSWTFAIELCKLCKFLIHVLNISFWQSFWPIRHNLCFHVCLVLFLWLCQKCIVWWDSTFAFISCIL